MHPSTLGLLLAVVPDCANVLLDPGLACAGDVACSLLCVLELELGLVAGFVKLGLGVVSVCATAPRQIVKIKGNTNESTRFIERYLLHVVCELAYDGSARGMVSR
jgi:hypothetical protein